jgi:phage major head subunit gpT-like protein
MPSVSEWFGMRRVRSPKMRPSYTATARKWENTVGIEQDVIDDDQLQLVTPAIQEIPLKAVNAINRLCFSTLAAGFTTVGPEGGSYYFFNDTHLESAVVATVNDNKLGTTAYGGPTQLQAAMAALSRFTDMDGEALNLKGNLLVGPPELEGLFRTTLYAEYYPISVNSISGAAVNVWKGVGDYITTADLSDTTDWFWLKTDLPTKPILLIMRQSPTSQELAKTSDAAFFYDMQYFGTKSRYTCAFGPWQLAVGSVVA